MRWLLLDVTLAVLALGTLVAVGLSLWGRIKALNRQVALAGERIGKATDAMQQQQAAGLAGGLSSGASTKETLS